ncbi:MAG TPA: ABC transporter permease [Terriglobia bacterium]|nr:ABC transporter permease [Terriglobia bacterium]
MPKRILSLFRNLFHKRAVERELNDELRSSLEILTQEKMKQGLSQSEARRESLIELGGVEQVKEEVRAVRAGRILEDFARDIRFAFRTLAKSPSFTVVAVLTLALGIGANTAIFSMVNGIMLSALPYRQSQQLYAVNETVPQFAHLTPWGPYFPVNAGNFAQWKGHCPAFSAMALIWPATFNMAGHGIPRQVKGLMVSADFFSLMGIRPFVGRAFLPQENQVGRDHEIVLTAQFWRQAFNSDPRIIGQTIRLDDVPYTVVGIMPESFRFPELPPMINYAPQFFKPIGFKPWMLWSGIGGFNFEAIARLKQGTTPQQALAQLDFIEARIARKGDARRHIRPGAADLRATLRPLKTVMIGSAQRALLMLMVAAGLILLIICINLANLMLVRNAARAHEVAVRSALGATAKRLLRQFFAEGLILAMAGAGFGLLLAILGLRLLVRYAPLDIPRVADIRIGPLVLLFTISISTLTALLLALLPALRLVKTQPVEALKSAGPAMSGSHQSARLRSGLVVGQIALCCVLLAGALLLIESLRHVAHANQWMEQQHVLAAELSLPPRETSTNAQTDHFLSNVLARVRAIPGVRDAGFTSLLPLRGPGYADDIDVREDPPPPGKRELGQISFVSSGYFQAVGIPLVRGRLLSESDRGKDVVVISESIVRRCLHGRNPIGMHLLWGADNNPKPREIIGEVADVRTASDQSSTLTVYVPIWTYNQTNDTLVVRTAFNPSAAANSIAHAVWSVDPEVAIPRERTLATVVSASEAIRRYETFLGTMFAAFALLLAAVGLYGVVSYLVSQRTHEIGIRMALGAQRSDVLGMVLREGIKLALFGVVIGVVVALGVTRFLSNLLYGVKPTDPLTFVAVSMLLTGVALLACWIPARQAAKVDPMVALRHE